MDQSGTISEYSVACIISMLGVFSAIPAAGESLNGFVLDNASIPTDEILDGGPGRGGIPALNQPRYVTASNATFLHPEDRVLGARLNGITRAYPIKILNYHEIVNDTFGAQAVVITYCPLCGSGMAFHGDIDDRRLSFGVSGLLFNSDVLLYDLQTESLWSQIRSAAVSGPMNGKKLHPIPLAHTTWRDWKARHPDSLVLSTDTGHHRNYDKNPYPNYDKSSTLFFPVATKSRKYRQKSLVMGLEISGQFKAYPFDELKQAPPQFADTFQGHIINVIYDDDNCSARIVDEDGNELPTVIAFWFAWYAFHPDTMIFTAKTEGQ
jgi:hypothetical protein